MKRTIREMLRKLPKIGPILNERDNLRKMQCYYPGHFHSPIPHLDDVERDETRIFDNIPRRLPGVDLREQDQIRLFDKFREYYSELPFEPYKTDEMRYFFENTYYSYSDAIFLYCMIRYTQPKNFVEVGSGYSSCAVLDTNELFFRNSIECTFIDPYPERLLSLIKEEDKERIRIITDRIQDVNIEEFSALSEGDILLIDSTHVSKVGSDINYIFHEILPCLKEGVYIHFHDIFYPFEYPKEWVYAGKAWNEAYLLRAFLQYNNHFEIVFFNTFLEFFYEDRFLREMPLCMNDKGGSIWIKKT